MNNKNKIPVVFASDDNYLPYLAVTIKSLIEHISSENFYELFILENKISEYNKKNIQSLSKIDNVKIEFINVADYLNNLKSETFFTSGYINISSYFRCFIIDIFKDYDKVIYLDSDIIILEDIANLYNITIPENKALGVIRDIGVVSMLNNKSRVDLYKFENYFKNTLNLLNPVDYFQAGVLLMNLKELRRIDLVDLCLKKTKEIKTPLYYDQCILNSIFCNQVDFLPMKWNLLPYLLYDDDNMHLSDDIKNIYYEIIEKKEGIIHYATYEKPWRCPNLPLAQTWWKYARLTPFYEEIIYRNAKEWSNITYEEKKLLKKENYFKFKYLKYKFLYFLSFGKKRKQYNEKLLLYKFNYDRINKIKYEKNN